MNTFKREIKFRAWDDTLLKMMEPLSLQEVAKSSFAAVNWYQLTIMQYTGLKDKNDTEIYEGDIIYYEGQDGELNTDDPFVVEYCTPCAAYLIVSEYGQSVADCPEYYNVIGNIYENPELSGAT